MDPMGEPSRRARMCILLPLLFAAVGLPARGKTFHVDGVVISVDRSAKTVTVSHRPIPKYMGAMVMPFQVEDGGELEALHPGNRVEFELICPVFLPPASV